MTLRTLHRHRAVAWTGAAAGTLVLTASVVSLIERIRTGHGLDSYKSGMGIETNAVQVLASMAFVAAVSVVALTVIIVKRRGLSGTAGPRRRP